MSASLAVLMAFTAAALAIALCAVLWRKPRQGARPPAVTAVAEALPPPEASIIEPFPDGSALVAQLETDQILTVQTVTARYVLRLIDPDTALFEATRNGRQKDGTEGKTRFQLFFTGTFVPHRGLRFGAFVPGGTLVYRRVRMETAEPLSYSTKVQRVLISVPEGMRQAS